METNGKKGKGNLFHRKLCLIAYLASPWIFFQYPNNWQLVFFPEELNNQSFQQHEFKVYFEITMLITQNRLSDNLKLEMILDSVIIKKKNSTVYRGLMKNCVTGGPVREGCWIVGRSKYHSVSLWRFFLWLGSKRRERRERRMMRLSGKENSLPALVHPRFPWTRIIDLFAVDVCFRDGACSNGTRSSPNLLLSFVEGDNKKRRKRNHRI